MRIYLTLLLLFLALFSSSQELTEKQRIEADAARERTLKEVARQFPSIKVDDMLDFYEQNAPDTLNEWRVRCIYSPNTAQDYLNTLAKRYAIIEDMRKKAPDFYLYNVEQLRMEMEIRKLSFAIKTLQQNKGDLNQIQESKAKLEIVLKTSFDKSQEMEEKKLRNMEAQLNELRSQIQKRAANRELIIQQKLKLLTESNQ
ncbi:MAG: hypothetical protein IKS20_01435 [Victivallales bacterium]|nr:hypothetical protein [Victivallales bacterium]